MFVYNVVKWCLIVVTVIPDIEPTGDGRGIQERKFDALRSRSNVAAVVDYPFLVGLMSDSGTAEHDDNVTAVCTGTLVTSVFVLSSAYCTSRFHIGIKAYRRKTTTTIEYRRTAKLYVHPSYDSVKRVGDLSLTKLEKPFSQVDRFVALSTKTFKDDVELDCMVVGIGALRGRGYQVPVRVRYGRSACVIPEFNTGLKYIIAYTWTEFLCARTVDGLSPTPNLPCDSAGDALLCRHQNGRTPLQYGVFSYAYGTIVNEVDGCGHPTVQARHMFVNKHADWIAETVSTKRGTVIAGGQRPRHYRPTAAITPQPSPLPPRKKRPPAANADRDSDRNAKSLGPENYPYLVYLEGNGPGEPVCGGTLISAVHVLTSAYCTTRMSDIRVCLLTASRKQCANADYIYVHPDYETSTLKADISIVVVEESFNMTRFAQLVDFTNPLNDNETKVMDCVIVAKKQLTPYYYVPVKVKYGPKACRKSFDSEIQMAVNQTWREFICALSPKNRHAEDTGDPLICYGLQYGIISHSYSTFRQTGTAADQVRFLVINKYRQWIDDVITDSRSNWTLGNRIFTLAAALFVLFLRVVFVECLIL